MTDPAAEVDGGRAPVLVIGVGSELREDDAAGRHAVERLAARLRSGGAVVRTDPADVELRSVTELLPELAADAVGRRLMVVIDASTEVSAVTLTEVRERPGSGPLTHHVDVGRLLAFAAHLGVPPVRTVTVAIPAHRLGVGMELSEPTDRAVTDAVARVLALIEA